MKIIEIKDNNKKKLVVDEAELHNSSHEGARPAGTEILLIVIHSIGLPPGEYGTDCVRDLFLDRLDYKSHPSFEKLPGKRLSAHIFLRRDGKLLQFVSFDRRANHAGDSRYKELKSKKIRDTCNHFSIGIELEGAEDDGYEDIQYEKTAILCALLMKKFPTIQSIIGHRDIAGKERNKDGNLKLRKYDPWNFRWDKFHRELDKVLIKNRMERMGILLFKHWW